MFSWVYTLVFFLLPGICIKAIHFFQRSFGKTDQTRNMHKSRNKQWVDKQSTFGADVDLDQVPQTSLEQLHQQDAKKAPLHLVQVGKDKAPKGSGESHSRLLMAHWHLFLPSAVFRTLLGRSLLMVSWHFTNSKTLKAERARQIRDADTEPLQPQEELHLKGRPFICRHPDQGTLALLLFHCFFYHFHQIFHNKQLNEFTENHRLWRLKAG